MPEHVIVLHGLGLHKSWMSGLASSLRRQGYIVHNITYMSRRRSFENIVDETLAPLVHSLPPGKIHFAVHSMGGLVVRLYAEKYGAARIGRVVMFGTPNHGTEMADFFSSWKLFKIMFGKTGEELTTGKKGIASRLGPVSFECGVIAGRNHWLHFPSNLIVKNLPQPNDGQVSVESTKVAGMKDHLVLNVDHTLMVWYWKVWRQTASFLKTGKFER